MNNLQNKIVNINFQNPLQRCQINKIGIMNMQEKEIEQIDQNEFKVEIIEQNKSFPTQIKKSQEQIQKNNLSLLSVSQASCVQKQQKQSSNDGLNTQRSQPLSNSNYEQKDKVNQINQNQKQCFYAFKKQNRQGSKIYSKQQENMPQRLQELSDLNYQNQIVDSQLKYESGSITENNKRKSFHLLRLLLLVFKKEYFFQIIRVLLYAFISITVFSYVLDQSKQKKQFYQAFYSSQQITISKEINGVFPPLFGTETDILDHTWILQTYNRHLLIDSLDDNIKQNQELVFEFKKQNILYIRPSNQKCVQQLKFKWKTFDYIMRIYEILQSEFQKIQDQTQGSCFSNKKQINKLMREISIWTIDWESKQLYLLSEPFREQTQLEDQNNARHQRWNQLVVLKKHINIV